LVLADTHVELAWITEGRGRADDVFDQAELTTVGWIPSTDLALEDWLRQGARLGAASRHAPWWIGDWVRYGAARYGSKYDLAARTTGYDRHTLMNMVYVASRFETVRRRENLSWSHHAEVASLDEKEQERWLTRATKEKLSVRGLRNALATRGTRGSTAR
jgi:hypothetical protein